ncbi:MAG: ATP-binding protein [Gemmataceae bacterium]
MKPLALGEAITQLAWLCPSAASLLALTRSSPSDAWNVLRSDPGAVLLAVRQGLASSDNIHAISFPSLLYREAIPLAAWNGLGNRLEGYADWGSEALAPVYLSCRQYAQCASHLAKIGGHCGAEVAWTAGLLAPLGWLAVSAVAPDLVTACLTELNWKCHVPALQEKLWGGDHAAIARRLNRRWRLPGWLSAVTGNLGLPAEVAEKLGADAILFRTVQLAVLLCQEQGQGLALAVGANVADLAQGLSLSASDLDSARNELASHTKTGYEQCEWQSPYEMPLLSDLLRLMVENRRLRNEPVIQRIEEDLDALQSAYENLKAGEAERLQNQKLTALAEFAAGAGHEINNPLAVISGQAQYLLGHEPDPDRQRSLQTIVSHAQRIHHLLVEVMHFARPPQPHKESIDLASLMREAAQSLQELAQERRVQIRCPEPATRLPVVADPVQVRTALTCLLRNAVEAAPMDGWAALRVETPAPDLVEVVVEDSGPGLAAGQTEHLFDPFYSGRQAGRGRGLGLPTAWRLANVQGGDIRYVSLPDGPTRFIFRLPRQLHANGALPNGQNGR